MTTTVLTDREIARRFRMVKRALDTIDTTDPDEAAKVGIIRSLLAHREENARTLELIELALDGASLGDLAVLERLEREG